MKKNNLLMYLLPVMALLIIALPLAGCTGSGSTAGTTATGHETNQALKNEILMENNTFKPDNITIKVGDTITWINNDSYGHKIIASNGEFNSGNRYIASGKTFSFTFTKEGTYFYTDESHPSMKGTITVSK
jgi:plastocyanin